VSRKVSLSATIRPTLPRLSLPHLKRKRGMGKVRLGAKAKTRWVNSPDELEIGEKGRMNIGGVTVIVIRDEEADRDA